ncbi:hypothetical protein DL93DRAFT_2164218 [Clavulina sp. PMI_390]|nr:hypothetical protein DL93DRAFT_2164218 [Clavulina sp. PMI_390]
MNDPIVDRQLREREYAASLAAYSLQGFMRARSQYFHAHQEKRPRPTSSQLADEPPVVLERSKIRSPLERRRAEATADRSDAASTTAASGTETKASSGNGAVDPRTWALTDMRMSRQASDPAAVAGVVPIPPGEHHPRRMGKNGTPHPSDVQCTVPLLPSSPVDHSPTSSVSTLSSPHSPSQSPSTSEPDRSALGQLTGQGPAKQRGRPRSSLVPANNPPSGPSQTTKCAEPAFSLGLPQGGLTSAGKRA